MGRLAALAEAVVSPRENLPGFGRRTSMPRTELERSAAARRCASVLSRLMEPAGLGGGSRHTCPLHVSATTKSDPADTSRTPWPSRAAAHAGPRESELPQHRTLAPAARAYRQRREGSSAGGGQFQRAQKACDQSSSEFAAIRQLSHTIAHRASAVPDGQERSPTFTRYENSTVSTSWLVLDHLISGPVPDKPESARTHLDVSP